MGKRTFLRENFGYILAGIAITSFLLFLYLYKLGSIAGGLSESELKIATLKVSFSHLLSDPLYLPLKLVRYVTFFIFSDHGQTLSRLPNIIFGLLTAAAFAWCIWLWHGIRTCFLISLLFITSAWVLHVSRTATFDVLYLWSIPTLLLLQALIHEHKSNKIVWFFAISVWTLIAFVPGMIWLIIAQLIIKRRDFINYFQDIESFGFKLLLGAIPLVGLSLLIFGILKDANLLLWLGIQTENFNLIHNIKNLIGVPVHILMFGPLYPDIWLGHAPIFDAFTWLCAALGVYFYIRKFKATRAITLFSFIIICTFLVGTLGLIAYSSLVALGYMIAAAGIAYQTYEWMKVFPRNPLARAVGITIIASLVCLACVYNLRSYYVAWPHNVDTLQHFNNKL